MLRRSALLAIAAILAALVLATTGPVAGHSSRMLADGGGLRSAGPTPLPDCAYLDILTRFRSLDHWRKTSLDTRLRVGKKYLLDDLVPVSQAGIGGTGKVRRLMIDDLRALKRAAARAGKSVSVRSAYRSYRTQQSTFAYWVSQTGYQDALKISARAGHSEHQLGTTIDFRSASSTRAPWDYDDWAKTGPGKWMKNNAWKYGFIMSYPKGETSTTCYSYEPWHYRYVGRSLAEKVHDSGLTLREYLWRYFESQ